MSEATSSGMIPVDTMHGDDIDARSIVIWGLVCVFITIITFAALYAMYNLYAVEQRVEKSYNAKYEEAASALGQQAGTLEQPMKWLDQQGQTVGVPISKAMELVVDDYKQDAAE